MFQNKLINHRSNILCKLWSIINWIILPRTRLLHGIMDMPHGHAGHMMSCSIVALICIQKLLRHQLCAVDDGLLVSNSVHICVLEQWVHRLGVWAILLLSGDAKVQGGVVFTDMISHSICCWVVMSK